MADTAAGARETMRTGRAALDSLKTILALAAKSTDDHRTLAMHAKVVTDALTASPKDKGGLAFFRRGWEAGRR